MCDTSIPVSYLSDGDPDDTYKGFTFTLDDYPFEDAVFDDDWATPPDDYDYTFTTLLKASNLRYPLRLGATVTFPNVGVWTDPLGGRHDITATLSVVDTNGGFIGKYSDGIGIFANSNLQNLSPLDCDGSKRGGMTVRIDFTYADTGEPVPDSFAGLTGFLDLDGGDTGDVAYSEAVEVLDGGDGIFLPDDMHLMRFGRNGYAGDRDENTDQLAKTTHAQQHMFTVAFTGPSLTIRYSQGEYKNSYAISFGSPLLADQLRYTVTAKAVDGEGNVLKEWTVADSYLGGTVYDTDIPDIDGYEYVGLADGSLPLSGAVTGNGEIILTYTDGAVVAYDPNGGSGSMDASTGVIGDTVTLSDNGFTRPGYTFTGWNTKPDGTGESYAPGDDITLAAGGITLYAQWEAEPAVVTYDPNGGSGSMDPYDGHYDDTLTLSDNGFDPVDGCSTFTGWNTEPDGTGEDYEPGDEITLDGDVLDDDGNLTLYAQWEDDCAAADETVADDDGSLAQTGVAAGGGLLALLTLAAGVTVTLHRRRMI